MPQHEYVVKVAVAGLTLSWLHTRALAPTAERAIDLVDADERAHGYTPVAFKAENVRDGHDVAIRGAWPFKEA